MALRLRFLAFVFGVMAVLSVGLFVVPVASAAGLVPICGSGKYDQAIYCQFCHLFELFNNVIQYLILFGTIVAAIAFAVAGFIMFTAGGSPEKVGKAKAIFADAFIGFVIALVSVLAVQTLVNSLGAGQLTWQQVQCTPNSFRLLDGGLRFDPGAVAPEGLGNDLPDGWRGPLVTTGDCAASSPAMRASFGSLADQFSCICQKESASQPIPSQVDKSWIDGKSFSYGYMQINMVTTKPFQCDPGDGGGSRTFDCRQAFAPGTPAQMAECRMIGTTRVCGSAGYAYKVVKPEIYRECTKALSTRACNFAAAWELYKSGGFQHWNTTARACGLLR